MAACDLRTKRVGSTADICNPGNIQGTFGVIQGTLGVIQGTLGVIQGTLGLIQGTFSNKKKVQTLREH